MDDFSQQITSLRQSGADQLDPIRLHHLEVLARRASAQQGPVRQLLDAKLALAIAEFSVRMAQARLDAPTAAAPAVVPTVGACPVLPQRTPLARLAADLAQQTSARSAVGEVDSASTTGPGLRPELAATRYFRNTWSRLSIDKRVTQAIAQAPKNAGPINSHQLVLRSLALMRELSPDYLNRFTAYADALLCLDQQGKKTLLAAKKAATASRPRKKPMG
jgi:hypothetical protein